MFVFLSYLASIYLFFAKSFFCPPPSSFSSNSFFLFCLIIFSCFLFLSYIFKRIFCNFSAAKIRHFFLCRFFFSFGSGNFFLFGLFSREIFRFGFGRRWFVLAYASKNAKERKKEKRGK